MRQAYFQTGFEVLLVEIPDAFPVSTVKDPMAIGGVLGGNDSLLHGTASVVFLRFQGLFQELHDLFPLSCEKDAFWTTLGHGPKSSTWV